MDEEEDDDIYAPEETHPQARNAVVEQTPNFNGLAAPDQESGEEVEGEESDSDIDIITEKKEEPKKETAQDPRFSSLKASGPVRSPSNESAPTRRDSPTVKADPAVKESHSRPGASYPAIKSSAVDVDSKPTHESSGKLITEIDMDADFGEDDKAWRRPGTDVTDYFNYGFDEFTWANYCLKQQSLRKETSDSKKQMDDMKSFLNSGVSGVPGMPSAQAGGMPQMPNMGDVPPEMQQMFGQMMAQGMDPSQMDPATFMQMMSGAQGGQGGDQSQSYGGQGYGQQHNQQQMGYGYGGGNQGGRGRGRRW